MPPERTSQHSPTPQQFPNDQVLVNIEGLCFKLKHLMDSTTNKKPRHLPAIQRPRTSISIFQWADLKAIAFERSGDPDHWRFYKKGCRIDPVLLKLVDSTGQPKESAIESLLNQSGTVRLDRLDLHAPKIRSIAEKIMRHTGARVRAVAIASGGSVQGMPKHYDPVDVIAIQTVGTKRWNLFGGPTAGCGVFGKADPQPETVSDFIELSEGDILFVPAGIHHCCTASEPSLHIAFTLKWPTLMDIRRESPKQTESKAAMEPIRFYGNEQNLISMAAKTDRTLPKPLSAEQLENGIRTWLHQRDHDIDIEESVRETTTAAGFAG